MKRIVLALMLFAGLAAVLPARSAGPMNVIVISVDTLRADRMSAYGYNYNTSPNLDKLFKRGTVFEDAMTNVPLTSPSFSSMFSGLYPHETGSIRNGIPMVDAVTTLPMTLKKRGYTTAAFISNWPLKRHLSNLHRGFDIYEDDFKEKRWLFFNDERDAKGVTEVTLDWLKEKPKEPFFAWVHYSDPHAPYLKHDDYMFGRAESDSANYDSEIGYTDREIGRVVNRFEELGLLSNSLVVFLSDHGESLGEHKYVGHGRNVYQPSMHVPFALIGPGVPAGKREKTAVQLLDLTPTILGHLGLPIPGAMTGIDLVPRLTGEKPWPDREIFYETYPGAAPQVEGAEKMLTKPIYVGYRQGAVKVMFNVRYQKWEKYGLATDPGELKNLVNIRDQQFIAESDRLAKWYGTWEDKTVVGSIGAMSEEDRKAFGHLGYIDP